MAYRDLIFCCFIIVITRSNASLSLYTSMVKKFDYYPEDERPVASPVTNRGNRLCVGEVKFQCNVSNSILTWDVDAGQNKSLDITVSIFDKTGFNKTVSDFTVTVLGIHSSPTSILSEIRFNATIKYNNTKIFCTDGVSGIKSESICNLTIHRPPQVENLVGHIKESQLDLSWMPVKTIYENITYYHITVSPPPGKGNCPTGQCNTRETKYSITNLPYCKDFEITVQAADNCTGLGKPSYWRILYEPPSAVQNLAVSSNSSALEVKWNAPENAGGPKKVDGYIVTVEPAPQSGNCAGGECIVNNNFQILSGLKQCQNYTVSVVAANCLSTGSRVSAFGEINDNSFNFSVAVLHKIIQSCNDTVDIEYEWTGCSPIKVDFLIIYIDGYDSSAHTKLQPITVQPGSKKLISLPFNFDLEVDSDYSFSVFAYHEGTPLTDIKIGYLSSKALCSNEKDVCAEILWKWPLIVAVILNALMIIIIAILVIVCVVKAYRPKIVKTTVQS